MPRPIRSGGKPGATGKESDLSSATQSTPIPTRGELGAGFKELLWERAQTNRLHDEAPSAVVGQSSSYVYRSRKEGRHSRRFAARLSCSPITSSSAVSPGDTLVRDKEHALPAYTELVLVAPACSRHANNAGTPSPWTSPDNQRQIGSATLG